METIIGTYRLTLFETLFNSGGVDPVISFGSKPNGLLCYESTGMFSIQFMSETRNKMSTQSIDSTDKIEAFDSYYAYFGTYDVEPSHQIVNHHVLGSLHPYEVGRTYRRKYEISDQNLVLTTIPGKGGNSGQRILRLTFQRVVLDRPC